MVIRRGARIGVHRNWIKRLVTRSGDGCKVWVVQGDRLFRGGCYCLRITCLGFSRITSATYTSRIIRRLDVERNSCRSPRKVVLSFNLIIILFYTIKSSHRFVPIFTFTIQNYTSNKTLNIKKKM